ncbi:MAG: acyl-CoA thioesterase [Gammaproteobacteria bacterium]
MSQHSRSPEHTSSAPHPFDAAVRLVTQEENLFQGKTSPAYGNMVGPFGGITAATLLNAAWLYPRRLGEPVSLTVNYAGPIADGSMTILATPVRTNRSTQHWIMELSQGGEIAATATAVFAIRRETWSSTEATFPSMPEASTLGSIPLTNRVAWIRNYDMRFSKGGFPDFTRPQPGQDSVSSLWVRDEPPRPLDFLSLAAICDVFFPRSFLRRQKFSPAGTVSLTSYFHADSAAFERQADRAVLATARASHFGKGYFDQSAQIWGDGGVLLATSHQIVYFKD